MGQSTIDHCGGYFSFFFQKVLLALILAKYYFFVSALCVCMHNHFWCCIYSCTCVLYSSFAHRAPLKISIWLLSGPLFKNYNYIVISILNCLSQFGLELKNYSIII